MLKFLNNPKDVARETLEGYAAAHPELEIIPGTLGLVRRDIGDRVVVVVGGGSGHEPVWLEYVGGSLADAVCQGAVFAAPSPTSIVQVAQAASRGRGVLFLYGNYSGDRMNFDFATEELEDAGIDVRTVRVADDIAAAPLERRDERRGIAGGYFATRVAAAAAARGDELDAVYALTARAAEMTRSIGVASGPGTIPGSDEPTFTLPEGRMEVGMGMHGEQGVWSSEMLAADQTVDKMVDLLLADRPLDPLRPVAVMINGLGATTRAELWIVARRTLARLAAEGIVVQEILVGEYATSQEMHGFSISLFELDSQLAPLYSAVSTPPPAGGLA